MKTTIITLIIWMALSFANAQDRASEFRQLYQQQKYDEITKYKPKKNEELSAKALYYKGMAYYMRSEDGNAMKYLDMAIEKGPVDYDMFYYKGMLLYYANRLQESLPYFDHAISLLPSEPDFYAGKGDVYYKLGKMDSAIVYFEKAATFPACKTRIYLMMGEIYQGLKNNEKGLIAYQTALGQMGKNDKERQDCSFNLGLMQQLSGKISDAKATFKNHASDYPSDYHAIAKLIQVYYSLSEVEKATAYEERLYAAHKANKLPSEMKEMFCFDQFIWHGKRVMAFENFDIKEEDPLSVKHHFYVMDDKGEIDYRVDSETSLGLRMNSPKTKYVLCLVKDKSHFTYWQYVFTDDYKYTELKAAVLDILDEKVKPGASFIPGKSNQ